MLATVIQPIGVLVALGIPKCHKCGKPYALDAKKANDKSHMCYECNLEIARRKMKH